MGCLPGSADWPVCPGFRACLARAVASVRVVLGLNVHMLGWALMVPHFEGTHLVPTSRKADFQGEVGPWLPVECPREAAVPRASILRVTRAEAASRPHRGVCVSRQLWRLTWEVCLLDTDLGVPWQD